MKKSRVSCLSGKNPGFTLVELLITMTIIGILAAVCIPAYYNYVKSARTSTAQQNLLDVKTAQEMYYALYNSYASSMSSSTFSSMLNFNASDSTYFVYSITAADTTSFTALIESKLDSGDCYQITESLTEAEETSCP